MKYNVWTTNCKSSVYKSFTNFSNLNDKFQSPGSWQISSKKGFLIFLTDYVVAVTSFWFSISLLVILNYPLRFKSQGGKFKYILKLNWKETSLQFGSTRIGWLQLQNMIKILKEYNANAVVRCLTVSFILSHEYCCLLFYFDILYSPLL